MARLCKTHIEGALYFITSRGDNRKDIFKEKDDYLAYVKLLKRYKQQYDFKLFAFVLVPDHLHLLIELREGITISDITHDLNGNYTKYFNARFQRKGHLFQERYKMALIEKTSYLLSVGAYIHLNPKILGITSDMRDYSYSSYNAYVNYSASNSEKSGTGLMASEMKEEIQQAIGMLPGTGYEDFLNAVTKQEIDILGRSLRKNAILGSDDFISRIQQEASSCQTEGEKKLKISGRMIAFSAAAVILFFSAVSAYFMVRQHTYKTHMDSVTVSRQAEVQQKFNYLLKQEKNVIRKDLEEKYQADLVSSKALSERLLRIERERTEGLKQADKRD